jgi:glycosyltransferase involved in cell wall biosynthesis
MNWLHRLRRTGLRHFLRAESGNWLLAFIRSRIAHRVVYQSDFSRRWWERLRGVAPCPSRVVYNGVDLAQFSPAGSLLQGGSMRGADLPPAGRCRLLLVEGSLMGGYEMGLESAVHLAEGLHRRLPASPELSFPDGLELMIVGRVAPPVRQRWDQRAAIPIEWAGQVAAERIASIDRSAHLLYSADINPACPNAVIEALACGLPVVAFDTGALPELIDRVSGRVVPYGGDPWKLEQPDGTALVEAALEILAAPARFRSGARARAEAAFDLERTVDGYLQALLE